MYSCLFSDLKFSASLSRQREVLLSQLRVGKCMLMGSYRSLIVITLLCVDSVGETVPSLMASEQVKRKL
jgi:hypothetical protein